jgi:hypothetical protein
MGEISTVSPLHDSDLEGAARICLEEAATTDLDRVGNRPRRKRGNERGLRFKEALTRRMKGVNSILELGLSAKDCDWAANQAHRAVDGPGWEYRFRTAAMRLKVAALQQKGPA